MADNGKVIAVPRCARFLRRSLTASLVAFACTGMMVEAASAAQTKSFVVSWFHVASYKQDGDCPDGLATSSTELYKRVLAELNIPPDETAVLLENFANMSMTADAKGRTAQQLAANRGRIDGKPVNVYNYPESVPDPHIKVVQGRYANGFNLDGRGAASPNSFEDPDTHELGVNNQMYRAFGCFNSLRTRLPERPSYPSNEWSLNRNIMPAWLVSITGDDLSKDGDVTITFDKALEHVTLDAQLEALRDATYRIDPNLRSHVVTHGKLKDGVITTTEPFYLTAAFDASVNPLFELFQSHLRMTIDPDGSAQGYLGGYQPWLEFMFNLTQLGITIESMEGIDIPGLYYAFKRLADFGPDPVTGQNMAISTAYRIEFVPVFTVPASTTKDNRVSQSERAAHAP